MKSGKLENGFEFSIDETVLDDMRFFDTLSRVEKEPLLFPKVADMLLGGEQKERLYKHIEAEDGRVPIEAFSKCLEEIMLMVGEQGKNS